MFYLLNQININNRKFHTESKFEYDYEQKMEMKSCKYFVLQNLCQKDHCTSSTLQYELFMESILGYFIINCLRNLYLYLYSSSQLNLSNESCSLFRKLDC